MLKSLLNVLALTTLLAVACNKQETAPAPTEGTSVQQETTEAAHEAAEQLPANEEGSSTESQSE
ncbi:MAG: hypothetical protein COW00_04345 [Bdellovibrio sp. CG12_big_fil_rev_8_21_14_0_65_39_13]|nr:MAG: hypothetical protein COW78_12540 [Bdellovibrio sp. CG22_combo_CG10-13_8_21_14_all_39_27]PIQ61039.1 MAG: hypothetical protein COW00_04345 [Bdellovibrio sp. CG12_big_fil_rev_8_21_14_0_65_39_13]PIR36806.1 MAG: hypothetical protein COV37_01360 [Bdellovibrio sp. CG11_big_fil_rev_8_21_14_0_20_39_38]